MITLKLYRVEITPHVVLGVLTIEDTITCYVLEHPDKCVPPGEYTIDYQYSPRFNKMLWELIDVPGRAECKFHVGNTIADTEGCLLPGLGVGYQGGKRAVVSSQVALDLLHERLPFNEQHKLHIYNAIDLCGEAIYKS